jgi:5'(3')-deoxyribonucleotidase
MQLPRIAVDLDGVLANTMETCCKIINMRHSTDFKVSSFNRWKAWKTANISKDEFFRILDEAWFDWRSIPPTEQRLAEKVGRLLEFSEVDIVTGRSSETVPSAKSWLKTQEIRFNAFVRTSSGIEKVHLNYDIFIDDSPELMRALSSKPNGHAILYTQPWNKEVREMPSILRANRWNEIPELVQRILNVK